MVTIESRRPEDFPDWQEMKARSEQFDRDSDWLDEHYKELVALYPDELVAVYNGSVVAHGKTLEEFAEGLRAADAIGKSASRFVSSQPITLII